MSAVWASCSTVGARRGCCAVAPPRLGCWGSVPGLWGSAIAEVRVGRGWDALTMSASGSRPALRVCAVEVVAPLGPAAMLSWTLSCPALLGEEWRPGGDCARDRDGESGDCGSSEVSSEFGDEDGRTDLENKYVVETPGSSEVIVVKATVARALNPLERRPKRQWSSGLLGLPGYLVRQEYR